MGLECSQQPLHVFFVRAFQLAGFKLAYPFHGSPIAHRTYREHDRLGFHAQTLARWLAGLVSFASLPPESFVLVLVLAQDISGQGSYRRLDGRNGKVAFAFEARG